MADLPLDARARLAALKEACPEAAEIWRRLYPSDEKDKRAREVAEAERTARAQQEQRNREELCRRCMPKDMGGDAEWGPDAAAAARQVLAENGGRFTISACNRIAHVIREAQHRERAAKRDQNLKR
jgi:hypothetical protein